MRAFLATLLPCLLVPSLAEARPTRDLSGEFKGERWYVAQGVSAQDVTRLMGCPPPHCGRKVKRKWKKRHRPTPGAVSPIVKAPRHERAEVAARSGAVIVPLPRARPADAPEADEEAAAANAAWERIAGSLKPRRPLNIFEGFAREIARALPKGRSLAGVVAPLAAKARELADKCGSWVMSGVRKTYVAGTRRISLHASGRAVDMAGNPSCMYALLKGWPGGVSTDYARVRCLGRPCPHIHISYAPPTRGQRGREWGVRFAHRGGAKRTRYARHHKRHRTHYASAR